MTRAAPLLALVLLAAPLVGCLAPDGAPLQKGLAPGAPPAEPGPGWAPVEKAQIRPGVPIHAPKRDCASNFVFARPDNTSVFLGTTAYCFRDMPVGTLVTVGGPENLGVLVYSSYEAMSEAKEQDPDAAQYNDFAVIRIDSSARDAVHPGILHYGGPTAMADADAVGVGSRVRAYENASADLPEATAWREGVVTGKAGAWALLVHAALPATPGTMGGPVITADGRAVGVMVNLGAVPNPGANGVARLDRLMAYAESHQRLFMGLVTADLLDAAPLG